MRACPWLISSLNFRLLILVAVASVRCAHPPPPAKPAPVQKAAPVPAPPPPLSLIPGDVARTGLVATFVVPSLDHSLSTGVTLIKRAAPLPLDAEGVRGMLLAQAGLPPEVGKHLDLGAPISGAAVAAGAGRSPLTAFTFAVRNAADVGVMLAALGRTISRRGNAVQVENAAGDRGWFLAQGEVVVFADSDEALVRAGSMAVEARRQGKQRQDDISVAVFPEMLARAVGTDVKTALGRMVAETEARIAAGGTKLGPEAARQIREIADILSGASSAEFALALNEARGATFMMRLHPKAGSKLEGLARHTRTIPIDPSLVRAIVAGKDGAGFAMTSGYGGATLDQFRRQRQKLPANGGKGVAVAAGLLDALAEGLTGEFSMVGRAQPAMSIESVYPARDAASGGRIQKALLLFSKDAVAATVAAVTQGEAVGVKVQTVRQERLGKTRALHATMAVTLPGDTKASLRKLLGPNGLDVFIAVISGDRLAVTMGPGAKARLSTLATGPGPDGSAKPTPAEAAARKGGTATVSPTPAEAAAAKGGTATASPAQARSAAPKGGNSTAFEDAIAGAAGRSLFFFLDLRQAVSLVAIAADDPRLRAMDAALRAPMPVLGGASGDAQGSAWTWDLTFPPSCFSGIGAAVQVLMMMRPR